MYGGIKELMRNPYYYHRSSVGAEYSHWTDPGKQALEEYMSMMGHQVVRAEDRDLDRRAKDMVIKNLKGDSK